MAKASVIIPNTNSLLIKEIIHNLTRQSVDMSNVEVLVVGTDEPGLVTESELVQFVPTQPSVFGHTAASRPNKVSEIALACVASAGRGLCGRDADARVAPSIGY